MRKYVEDQADSLLMRLVESRYTALILGAVLGFVIALLVL